MATEEASSSRQNSKTRSWSAPSLPPLIASMNMQRSTSAQTLSTMAESAARKAWPFRKPKIKRRSNSLVEAVAPMTPIKEATDASPKPAEARSGRKSESDVASPPKDLDVDALAFQPGAPKHPMQPGEGFSLLPRQRSKTEPKGKARAVPVDASIYEDMQTARIFPELEYLTTPAPSRRVLSAQERAEARCGQEDVWLFLLQRQRLEPQESSSILMGKLLFDLENQFYSVVMVSSASNGPELTIRDEAMLEEAARLVLVGEEELHAWVERAKEIEARRWKRSARKSL